VIDKLKQGALYVYESCDKVLNYVSVCIGSCGDSLVNAVVNYAVVMVCFLEGCFLWFSKFLQCKASCIFMRTCLATDFFGQTHSHDFRMHHRAL